MGLDPSGNMTLIQTLGAIAVMGILLTMTGCSAQQPPPVYNANVHTLYIYNTAEGPGHYSELINLAENLGFNTFFLSGNAIGTLRAMVQNTRPGDVVLLSGHGGTINGRPAFGDDGITYFASDLENDLALGGTPPSLVGISACEIQNIKTSVITNGGVTSLVYPVPQNATGTNDIQVNSHWLRRFMIILLTRDANGQLGTFGQATNEKSSPRANLACPFDWKHPGAESGMNIEDIIGNPALNNN
jgi:hypothetical protein